ncbi:hypothetical protein [Marisediminicola sp. LYQ85]|uniref:hypothetical protein n=1 Tax=Marisediminicola sp. LYQ85 TaxID=3391062 RepID=UPI0039830763
MIEWAPGDAARIDEAIRRMRTWNVEGQPVRFVSTQSAAIVVVGVMLASTIVINTEDPRPAPALMWLQGAAFVAALALCIAGYVSARRSRRLLPQPPFGPRETPMGALTAAQRRSFARLTREDEPLSPGVAELLVEAIEFRRSTSRAILPSLLGLFSGLLAASMSLPWQVAALVAVAVIFLAIATPFETRRDARLLARARRRG